MATKKQDNKVQRVCFTLNNYSQEEFDKIITYSKLCKFMIVAKETGDEGTPHLQGFFNLIKRSRFTALKKLIPRAYLVRARGTDEQNMEYCMKQDKKPFIHGEPMRTGQRTDLMLACGAVLEKKPLVEIANENPTVYVKYYRGLQELAQKIQKPRDVNDPPMTIWIWGKSGVGKTRFAFDQLPHNQIYIKDGTQWWNNYENQQCILVDDFNGLWPFHDLLRFLDRYPYQGQTKGGYVQINSPIIIITCEYPPEHFLFGTDLQQLIRRLSYIINMLVD